MATFLVSYQVVSFSCVLVTSPLLILFCVLVSNPLFVSPILVLLLLLLVSSLPLLLTHLLCYYTRFIASSLLVLSPCALFSLFSVLPHFISRCFLFLVSLSDVLNTFPTFFLPCLLNPLFPHLQVSSLLVSLTLFFPISFPCLRSLSPCPLIASPFSFLSSWSHPSFPSFLLFLCPSFLYSLCLLFPPCFLLSPLTSYPSFLLHLILNCFLFLVSLSDVLSVFPTSLLSYLLVPLFSHLQVSFPLGLIHPCLVSLSPYIVFCPILVPSSHLHPFCLLVSSLFFLINSPLPPPQAQTPLPVRGPWWR